MRDRRLTSLRTGILAALGLLQACGGQVNDDGATPASDEAAASAGPGANAPPQPDDTASGLCEPMAVTDDLSTGNCWANWHYSWDGAHCEPLLCGCIGDDCGSIFDSVIGCYEERGPCDPLATDRSACIQRYPSEGDAAAGQARSECVTAGGTNCDAASFISQAAAVCIAHIEGMQEGIAPWDSAFFYNSRHGRVEWSLSNTTFRGGDGSAAGGGMMIDATTGFVVEQLGWAQTPGRPFLIDRAPRTADAIGRSDYSTSSDVQLDGISADVRATLAAEWTRVGLMEHASVAAFARFALQLLGLGAPPQLVGAFHQAMQDELRHTQIAFGLASAYAETPLGPGPLQLDGALDSEGHDQLAQVVMTTLVEGCIGETLAALDAREGAASAADPQVRAALSQIADDEERHAELAWRFLDWALPQRPALAAQALAAARAQLASASTRLTLDAARENARSGLTLLEHGILSHGQKLELEVQALEHVILPCLIALVSKHAPAPSPMGYHLGSA